MAATSRYKTRYDILNESVYKTRSLTLRSLAIVVGLITLITLSGCGRGHQTIPDDRRFVDADYNYVIGPGDTMEIFVWGNTELSTTSIVRPDGKLTTRLVEDLQASGKTPSELAREIEQVYGEYVRDPVVSVMVNGFIGVPSQQVRVVGEAMTPSSIPYSQHMTLLDLMVAVGGMTDYAAGNKSVLVRTHAGEQHSYELRLDDLLKKGDISANVTMMPGDVVIISESWF